MEYSRLGALILMTTAAAACSGGGILSRVTLAPSPHERYAQSLRDAKLADTALGLEWLRAGTEALAKPLTVSLPLHESGYFPADAPTAVAYRFELSRGRRLSVELTVDAVELPRLFVDVFKLRGSDAPERIASLDEGMALNVDAPDDGTYVIRIQPELLRSGRFTVVQRTLASLPFPVQGLTAAAVQSEFGAARDAGRRQHEGIDIFAPRATPVVAVVDGMARTGTNALGGNVVWLRGRGFGESFYYAHLDRWAFEGSSAVRAGDVVGYVGNTGNARTTSPHLHFGIYDAGAIDPLPFIRADDVRPAAPTVEALNQWVRVTASRAPLRGGTERGAPVVSQLNRHTLAKAVGASGSLWRIELPNRTAGYIDRTAVTAAHKPIRSRRIDAGTALLERPLPDAPAIYTAGSAGTADVLGEFNGFTLVRQNSFEPAWLPTEPSRQK